MAVCRLLRLRQVPILQQLRLEEALLRADDTNWCIINDGSATPAIVMGISGYVAASLVPARVHCMHAALAGDGTGKCRKVEELVHVDKAKAAGMQVIKRFSGGGTVVVDGDTVFSTLILQAAAVPGVECYPRPIMRWSEDFYRPVFGAHGDFSLREHGVACACCITACSHCALGRPDGACWSA